MTVSVVKEDNGQAKVLREYESLVHILADEDQKNFNVVRDGDSEGGSGLWDPETRAAIDAYTLKTLFFSEDWVFIVVDLIAMKISNQYLRVVKEINNDGKTTFEPAEDHPFQNVIDNPNQYQDYHAFMYSLVVDTVLIGNGILWSGLAGDRMIVIPVEQITPQFDQVGAIVNYQVTQMTGFDDAKNQRQMVASFPVDQVCHVRRPNPSSAIWGLSPFIPGKKSMLFNRYSSEYLNNYYLKGATPGLALEMEDSANEQNALRLLRSFEMAYTGRRNQRRTLVLPKGVKAKEVSHSLADQQLSTYLDKNRETILALLKVPPHEVGLQTGGSLGSEEYKTSLKNFWSSTLKPTMRMIAGAMTKHFQPKLGEGYFLEFVTDDIDALQENQVDKAVLAEKLLKTHTLNEIRAKLYDLSPVPGGDAVLGQAPVSMFGPAPISPISPAAPAAPAAPAPAAGGNTSAEAAANQLTSPTQSLNGAQVQALIQIVQAAAAGELDHQAAVNIIRVSFAVSQQDAEAILGKAGLTNPTDANPVTEAPLKAAEVLRSGEAVDVKDDAPSGDRESFASRLEKAPNNAWWQERRNMTADLMKKGAEDFTPFVLETLSDMTTSMIKAVKTALSEKAAERKISRAQLRRILADITKKNNFEEKWINAQVAAFESTVEVGYDIALSLPFKLPNMEQLDVVRSKNEQGRRDVLEERSLETFANISETTTEKVMSIVERGIKEQMTVDEIVRSIVAEPTFSKLEDVNRRAETIVRTETMVASSIGQAAMMDDAAKFIPNLKKMWVSTLDDRVRGKDGGLYPDSKADHFGLDRQVEDHDKPFVDPRNNDKLMYPRDTAGKAESTINCRCTMIVLPEDQMKEFES